MDLTNSAVWFAVALVSTTAVITKIARARTVADPVCNKPPPPVVSGGSLIRLLHTFLTKGLRAMIHEQYTQLGSVFTISFFGQKVTFLIGPEVLGHFYQGLDSEISHGNTLEFTVPMFGKEVLYGVDVATRYEQFRFYSNALKPPKLRNHTDPMVQEVEDYFSKWDQQGTVDLKWELAQLLMLISSRCLLGREVREKMFKEVYTLFHELSDNGLRLTSVLFPYAPTLANYRRDRAHAKLSEMFTKITDVLQNLMDSKYKDSRPTTEAEVIGLIMNLMFAGMHTSSAASTWTGVCLLSHERWLRAVIEEQNKIVLKHGDHVDFNALMEMDTLHRCIKETLRMHPPTATVFRKVHTNFTVQTREGYEYEIPSGHTVVSPIHFNSNLPYIYKDPDEYDPDRFGLGREEDRVGGKFSYTAFSGGRHACIGEAYAYMQIKVIWSHLLRNFELKLVSPFPDTDQSKLALEPKGKVMVQYKRLAAYV
ncbi:hypothetical protein HU200_062218 [Digitaria exilis]|uniref:Obtusifoliol 14-alpha demethylase n=1 Tax=Digitaria exilis TaxID=1010633 RepID=A0A835A7Q8_9POAL|nr:hypothetical protein HU200_062218 [Digitaria exilis]